MASPAGNIKKATINAGGRGLRSASSQAKPSGGLLSSESRKKQEEKPADVSIEEKDPEDQDEGDTLEDVEAQTEGMTVAFVAFSRQHAEHKETILSKINEVLMGCPELDNNSEWVADYDKPVPGSPDLMRIYVAFPREQDCRTFQSMRTIMVKVSDESTLICHISQELVWFKDMDDGVIRAFIKEMPRSFTPERTCRCLDTFKFGKAKRPMVKQAGEPILLKHKGGLVNRSMFICTIVPHDDDPECTELKGKVFIPYGKGKKGGVHFYVGCTKHVCAICGARTHLAEVHEQWAQRVSGKKRKRASARFGEAKVRSEGLPVTDALKVVVDDPDMDFVEDKGLGREAWVCRKCFNKDGAPTHGHSFSGAIKHAQSEGHTGKSKAGQ